MSPSPMGARTVADAAKRGRRLTKKQREREDGFQKKVERNTRTFPFFFLSLTVHDSAASLCRDIGGKGIRSNSSDSAGY